MSVAVETFPEQTSNVSSWADGAVERANVEQKTILSKRVQGLIREGYEAWNKLLFPTTRLEAWKYTNVDAIARGAFHPGMGPVDQRCAPPMVQDLFVSDLKCAHFLFVDGVFCKELSTTEIPKGVTISRLSDSVSNEDHLTSLGRSGVHNQQAFAALATALMTEAMVLHVAAGVHVDIPIQVVFVATNASNQSVLAPRIAVTLEAGSSLSLIECYGSVGAVGCLSLPVVEAFVAQNARLELTKVQLDSDTSFHMANSVIEQERDSQVHAHIFSFGSALARNEVEVRLKGPACSSLLNGLSVLNQEQHIDNATHIHHIAPNAESREHFKGIYSDKSRGVFSGTITVEREAQKTNAFQSNQAILLSSDAGIETRPQLKIWADDVKCTHGATVGQLDADALFYLQSRGLDKNRARQFLVQAFAGEVVATLGDPIVRDFVENLVVSKLSTTVV